MKSFNFENHKIENMYEPEIRDVFFDFDKDYLDCSMDEGLDNLIQSLSAATKNLEKKDYLIRLAVTGTIPDDEDLATIFSVFMSTIPGYLNDRGYLGIPERLLNRINGTTYQIIRILNCDFPNLSKMQFHVIDKNGDEIHWIV